jgi:hypothetical protein
MSAAVGDRGLIRWYPRDWQDRYGAELLAMVEDNLEGEQPTPGLRASLAFHGMAEHLRLRFGPGPDRAATRRAGARLVMLAWGLFVVAGCSFAKLAEHFQDAVPASANRIPTDAFDVVVGLAVTGAVLVAASAVALLPALMTQVLKGRGHTLDRPARLALALVIAATASTVGLAAWAHHLSDHQRNDAGFGAYPAAFMAWGVIMAAAIVASVVAAITSEARLTLSAALVRIETGLAAAVTACLIAMVAAVAVWWAEVAAHAPWFLHGTPTGTGGSPWSITLVATATLMVIASAIALRGCAQAAGADIGRTRR